MKSTRKLGLLSIAETQKLLGSEPPVRIGKLPTDPLGMRMIASIVRERLVSGGGRPSDPAWTVVKKVPMRPETWSEFNRCANELRRKNIRVSAGQIAAITLERSLSIALSQIDVDFSIAGVEPAISQSDLQKAHLASSAILRNGFYSEQVQCE